MKNVGDVVRFLKKGIILKENRGLDIKENFMSHQSEAVLENNLIKQLRI
jgi:hypothetical protein